MKKLSEKQKGQLIGSLIFIEFILNKQNKFIPLDGGNDCHPGDLKEIIILLTEEIEGV